MQELRNVISDSATSCFSRSVRTYAVKYTAFPHSSVGSQMSAGSKVTVFQMSAQNNESQMGAGLNKRWGRKNVKLMLIRGNTVCEVVPLSKLTDT